MKTIFITSFEGIETKNLLRTSIVSTIQKSEQTRIVVFVHDADRMAYHKKEFSDERMIYEVVPRPVIRGMDKLFQRLKFTLLRTETTDIRRRMKYELTKNFFFYAAGMAVNRIFARKFWRTLFRMIDYHLIINHDYDHYFNTYKPSLVVLANLFDEPEVHLLRAAKKYRVRSVGFINSWDKVTARCILRLLPDKTIVFNPTVKKELIEHNHVHPDTVFIGGMPQYDFYIGRQSTSRGDFLKKMNIESDMKFFLYVPIGRAFEISDWAMIDFLHHLIKANTFGSRVTMLVRFPPNDFINPHELAKRPWLIYDYPGFRFSTTRGTDWDMDVRDVEHLGDTLAHMSMIVGYASSIAIDAAVFDKPIIGINFEIKKGLLPTQSPTTYQKMVHCKTLLKPGGICFVEHADELIVWMKRYFNDPALDREGRNRLVREQCVYTDGKSGERIGQFILSLIA